MSTKTSETVALFLADGGLELREDGNPEAWIATDAPATVEE
ncbi:hypothetical protein ACFQH6_17740 [Halobacteriaceae archaeon GCM10025711]